MTLLGTPHPSGMQLVSGAELIQLVTDNREAFAKVIAILTTMSSMQLAPAAHATIEERVEYDLIKQHLQTLMGDLAAMFTYASGIPREQVWADVMAAAAALGLISMKEVS